MRNVLVAADYFLPGYRAGGPVRALANMIDQLGDQFKFFVLTRDHDLGDPQSYAHVRTNIWTTPSATLSSICYLDRRGESLTGLRYLASEVDTDVLYLNSVFSRLTLRLLWLVRLGLVRTRHIILAPRGELAPEALQHKRWAKRWFLSATRTLRWNAGVLWQATSHHEADDIRRSFGNSATICIAPDILSLRCPKNDNRVKRPGLVRLVYLSRIVPHKNLHVILEALAEIRGQVIFDIYGPIGDEDYWLQCQHLIAVLPSNCVVTYRGSLEPLRVAETLSQYEVFVLLSSSENYGHAIGEAMAAGCLVIINRNTVWTRAVEGNGGWVVLPSDHKRLISVLNSALIMDHRVFAERSRALAATVFNVAQVDEAVEATRKMLTTGMGTTA